MPPKEVVDEGSEESKQNQTSARNEAGEASIHPTGVNVKVQELVSLLAHRKSTSELVAINCVWLLFSTHWLKPELEPSHVRGLSVRSRYSKAGRDWKTVSLMIDYLFSLSFSQLSAGRLA